MQPFPTALGLVSTRLRTPSASPRSTRRRVTGRCLGTAPLRPWLALLTVLVVLVPLRVTADTHPFGAQDLVEMDRVSSPVVSPDGKRIAFVVRTTDLQANRGRTDLFMIGADGKGMRRLTTDPASDFSPVWSPDSRRLYFLSTRSGRSQVWRLDLDGGEAQPVSDLPLDVGDLKISPDGSTLAFSLEVFVDAATLDETRERLDAEEARETTGVVYDRVFVRHWDTWKDGRRRHVFFAPIQDDGSLGEAVDMMPGMDADCPSQPFGGAEEFTFTPDGRGLVFAARDVGASEPWSTDFDLYHTPAVGAEPVCLTTPNEAWDTSPVFSPDGTTLAYAAMAVPGYEADRFRVMLLDWASVREGKEAVPVNLTEDFDRSVGGFVFGSDGRSLFASITDLGHRALYRIDVETGQPHLVLRDGSIGGVQESHGRLYYTRNGFDGPSEIESIRPDGKGRRRLTHVDDERMAQVRLGAAEQFSFTGANGDRVYGWVVRPVDFDPERRYPVAFLIHGGPQGSFGSNFHYRWNPQVYAGAGYAAVMIDFHGSTGYGQAFTDAIRDNWGGWPLEDLQKGLAAALERYPWMDGDHVAALGASYGGYMINWIAGNWPDRFTCLVNHDGLFDTEFMYYSTEELWFPEHEFGGPPFSSRAAYDRWNPALHVDQWQTPMLVVHGGRDYRVPLTQGLATFNALQRRGVPSRFLYYPDENHWVLQPKNSLQWHEEVLRWLDQWTRPEEDAR